MVLEMAAYVHQCGRPQIQLPEKVDMIVSEPLGIMLVNERMLESYVAARKWFEFFGGPPCMQAPPALNAPSLITRALIIPVLTPALTPALTLPRLKPDGKMFPTTSTLFVAPFSDASVFIEVWELACAQQSETFCADTHHMCHAYLFFFFFFFYQHTHSHTHTLTPSLLHSFTPSLLHSLTHVCGLLCLLLQTQQKASFWQTSQFHGIDLTPLHQEALDEVFSQPCVEQVSPKKRQWVMHGRLAVQCTAIIHHSSFIITLSHRSHHLFSLLWFVSLSALFLAFPRSTQNAFSVHLCTSGSTT